MTVCVPCAAQWSGLAAAHCHECRHTFATSDLFDRHRHHRGPHGGCLDPATLVDVELHDGMWRPHQMAGVR